MFCPKCRAEYRPGFTHCPDCDAELVEELTHSCTNSAEPSSENMKDVWVGVSEHRCVSLCRQLRAAGIAFKVEQRKHQFLKGLDEHYKIGVARDLFDAARKIIIKGHPDFPDGEPDE